MKINLHLYPVDYTNEIRSLKVTKTISENFNTQEIHIVGIHKGDLLEEELLENNIKLFRIKLNWKINIPKLKSFFLYLEWYYKIIKKYRKKDISIIHSNSVYDLMVAVILKISKKNIKLIYDTHELATERARMSKLKKRIGKIKEKILIRYVDEIIVVSPSIYDWYKDKYPKKNISVIENYPLKYSSVTRVSEAESYRNVFNIPDSHIIFLYIGLIHKERGIELLLDSFSDIEKNKHLVIMGMGELKSKIIEYSKKYSNIHFYNSVSPMDTVKYAKFADVGIALIENTCLNHYYCLPNKLFQYLVAGLPVIVSDFPDMKNIITKHDRGWTSDVSKQAFVNVVQNIDFDEIIKKRENILANDIESWEGNSYILIDIYNKLLNNKHK